MAHPGVFLVLEGVDGCGKSTQALRLVRTIADRGRTVRHLREPGGTALGERIRSLLLDPATGHVAPIAEVFLYQAARAQLVEEVLLPALARGEVVVCERWHYATSAYQGVGAGAGLESVAVTSALATGGLEPDRAVLLDVPDEVAAGRLGAERDRIEARGGRYLGEVATSLRRLFAAGDGRLRTVSAAGTEDQVAAAVWEAVRDLF